MLQLSLFANSSDTKGGQHCRCDPVWHGSMISRQKEKLLIQCLMLSHWSSPLGSLPVYPLGPYILPRPLHTPWTAGIPSSLGWLASHIVGTSSQPCKKQQQQTLSLLLNGQLLLTSNISKHYYHIMSYPAQLMPYIEISHVNSVNINGMQDTH